MTKRIAVCGICLVAFFACVEERSPEGPTRTERDSAGVRIVEYPAAASWGEAPQLVERVRIGLLDGPEGYLFSAVAGGVLFDDGSFVIADRGSSEVRRFSSAGSLLSVHGREGQGPGEYEYIRGVGRCSYSGFAVFDLHWRLNQYDSLGVFVGSHQLRLDDGSTPYHLACSPSGRFAVTNWDRGGFGQLGVFTATARLRTLRPDGSLEWDLGERIGSERVGTTTGSGPHPFGRSTRSAFLGEDLIVADGSFFGYERWSREGRLKELVRLDVPPPQLAALVEEHVNQAAARAPGGSGDRVDARARALREHGETLRQLEAAAFARDLRVLGGHVLIQEQAASGPTARWFVFADNGTPLGFILLPPSAKFLDMNHSHILVAEVGEFDVPQVVRYEYQRPR